MPISALVVGAGQGIGRAVALDQASRGATVHLVGRTQEKLEEVALAACDVGGTAVIHAADVTDQTALDQLVRELGVSLDVLVHCVGESLMEPFVDTTTERWQHSLDVNLTSAFQVTRAALPLLRSSPNPSIVLLVSKVALRGYPVVAYSAAKAGVLGMARALATELVADGIRVVALCPGPTDTPMRWASTPDMDRNWVIDPASVAAAIRFVTDLPRGTTVEPLVVQAIGYE